MDKRELFNWHLPLLYSWQYPISHHPDFGSTRNGPRHRVEELIDENNDRILRRDLFPIKYNIVRDVTSHLIVFSNYNDEDRSSDSGGDSNNEEEMNSGLEQNNNVMISSRNSLGRVTHHVNLTRYVQSFLM